MEKKNGHTHSATLVGSLILLVLIGSVAWVRADPGQPVLHEVAELRTLEGPVASVDAVAGTIRVAWGPFGLLAKTLEVEGATQVRVVGRPATLADICETATVRVGYIVARGRSIAMTIDMVLAPKVSARMEP